MPFGPQSLKFNTKLLKLESTSKNLFPANKNITGYNWQHSTNFINNKCFFSARKTKSKTELIPKLAFIDSMVEAAQKGNLPNLSNTAFVGVQHMLPTTVTLFDALIKLGIKPQNMYFTGKCYSSMPEIETEVQKRKIHLMPASIPERPGQYYEDCRINLKKMWQFCMEDLKRKNIERLIILDEDGQCLQTMPVNLIFEYAVAGIQLTKTELYRNLIHRYFFPLIDIASSAAKKHLEPKVIFPTLIDSVKDVLAKLSISSHAICGVIGNGATGHRLAQYLLSQDFKVIVYDQSEATFQGIYNKNLYRVESIEHVIVNAQYIFSCTGKDITQNIDVLGLAQRDKTFISCGIEDKEFLSFLKRISLDNVYIDPLSDIVCRSNSRSRITILRSGFPINYHNKASTVPIISNGLIQGLALGGCLQAITSASRPIDGGITINHPSHQQLNFDVQKFVFNRWINSQPKSNHIEKLSECFNNDEWIKNNSGDIYMESEFLTKCFSKEKELAYVNMRNKP